MYAKSSYASSRYQSIHQVESDRQSDQDGHCGRSGQRKDAVVEAAGAMIQIVKTNLVKKTTLIKMKATLVKMKTTSVKMKTTSVKKKTTTVKKVGEMRSLTLMTTYGGSCLAT